MIGEFLTLVALCDVLLRILIISYGTIKYVWKKFRRKSKRHQSINMLGFSFSWTIDQFSPMSGKERLSPEFVIETTKWSLVMRSSAVDGNENLGLYIRANNLNVPLEIKYQLSFVDIKHEKSYTFSERSLLGASKKECGTPEFITAEEVSVQNGVLVNGSVTILAEIAVVNAVTENVIMAELPAPTPPSTVETAPDVIENPATVEGSTCTDDVVDDTVSGLRQSLADLRRDLGNLLGRDELSDLKIYVEGRLFYAHKAVVAVRCSYIADMFVDGTTEISLEGLDANAFDDVLKFIYTDDVDDASLAEKGEFVLKAAHTLGLNKLKELAETSLLATLSTANATTRLVLSYECSSDRLKDPILLLIKRHRTEVQAAPNWKTLKQYPEILLDLLNVA